MDILIVEDAADQRIMLAALLKRQGFQVLEASNGREAIDVLQQHQTVRMVISDWMMPEMDGIELCETLRKLPNQHYIYFILLTGNSDREAVAEGINRGADDFLKKPIQFNELAARLNAGKRIIELKSQLEQKVVAIESDLQSAAETQLTLLDEPAVIGNVGFNWYFKPSRYLGGDTLGYQSVDDDCISFYQLDVSGHGIPSALHSFSLNHFLGDARSGGFVNESITEAPYYRVRAPHEVLYQLNQQFQGKPEAMMYFTIAYGLINHRNGTVSLSLAGHPSPLWLQKNNQRVVAMPSGGVPVGMMPNMQYRSEQIQLLPGDRLFLYSDGLTECESAKGMMFGEERLMDLLSANFDCPLDELVLQVQAAMHHWADNDFFEDDVTFLVLEWTP